MFLKVSLGVPVNGFGQDNISSLVGFQRKINK